MSQCLLSDLSPQLNLKAAPRELKINKPADKANVNQTFKHFSTYSALPNFSFSRCLVISHFVESGRASNDLPSSRSRIMTEYSVFPSSQSYSIRASLSLLTNSFIQVVPKWLVRNLRGNLTVTFLIPVRLAPIKRSIYARNAGRCSNLLSIT